MKASTKKRGMIPTNKAEKNRHNNDDFAILGSRKGTSKSIESTDTAGSKLRTSTVETDLSSDTEDNTTASASETSSTSALVDMDDCVGINAWSARGGEHAEFDKHDTYSRRTSSRLRKRHTAPKEQAPLQLSPRAIDIDLSPKPSRGRVKKSKSINAVLSPRSSTSQTEYGQFFRRMRRRWETLGLILLIMSIMDMLGFFSGPFIHSFLDIYFLCDPFVRFQSGYIDSDRNVRVRDEIFASDYTKFWFYFDIFCAIPFGSLYFVWENRPGVRLLMLNRNKNPLFKFASSRFFRKEIFQNIRGHLAERHVIKNVVHFITNRHTSLATTSRPILRKVFKFITYGQRMINKYKRVKNVITHAHFLSGTFVATRTVSVLSSVRRKK
jgi:hypothetical protein